MITFHQPLIVSVQHSRIYCSTSYHDHLAMQLTYTME